jgi:putative mycofactocin binding protein MftB
VPVDLDAAYRLDPRVAIRSEPFGALCYHYGNRRLTFLRSPDMVRVVEGFAQETTVVDALRGAGVDEARWPAFASALGALAASEVLVAR